MNKIEYILQGKSGIYMFINLTNGKRYIGSSKDIYNRIHEHVHNLNNQKAHNKHFQASWNKYGENSFIFTVLEYCSEDSRFEREQYYLDVINPEYNLTNNVIANSGQSPSEETRIKISNTLKEKYKTGEIQTYRQEHAWIKTYIYNIRTLKLEAECDCRNDAFKILNCKKPGNPEKVLYKNRYCLSSVKFNSKSELQNYVNKNFLVANSKFGKYIITENPSGELTYYRTLVDCARDNFTSSSTLQKHSNASINEPYLIRKSGNNFYYSNEFYEIKNTAVPIEKSSELLQTNIGEDCDVNTEITEETKESSAS